GARVEAVTPPHHFSVSDRRSLGTVHTHIRGRLGHETHEQDAAADLEGYGVHAVILPHPIGGLCPRPRAAPDQSPTPGSIRWPPGFSMPSSSASTLLSAAPASSSLLR